VAAWGVVAWAFQPTQQSHLVHQVPQMAPVVLSLNSSAMYLGVSFGSLVSSGAVALGHVTAIGWIGGAFELVAFSIFGLGVRSRAAAPAAGAASAT